MNRIREFRVKNGMLQIDLAKKLNVTPSTIWAWEANRRKPKHHSLQEMAQIFNCAIDELLETEPLKQDDEIKKPTEILVGQLQFLSDICQSDTCSSDELAQLTEQMINICDKLQSYGCLYPKEFSSQ